MKKLFNFYLEEYTKNRVIQKLEDNVGHTEKGALAALIRVLLNRFMQQEDVTEICKDVDKEYVYSATKNKRSSM